jgi:hypothetical protein
MTTVELLRLQTTLVSDMTFDVSCSQSPSSVHTYRTLFRQSWNHESIPEESD